MRLVTTPVFFLFLAAALPHASATVATLGPTNQNMTFTGLGPTATGQGQSRMTWGSCAYDGTNTVCTLTGPFTGFGPSAAAGTFSFVFTYPGNGPSPLIAVSQTPGNDLVFYNLLSNGSFLITFTPANGAPVSFYNSTAFSQFFSTATANCTGVSSCAVGQVGLTPGATITGPVNGPYDTTPFIRNSLGVITASGYGGSTSIAPGTWIEIYGTNLATTLQQVWGSADFHGNQGPSTLGGTTVTVGGQPAFIDFVSPLQVNAQVPSGIAPGPQPVVVTTAGGSSAPTTVTVNAVQPGLLAPPALSVRGTQYVAALFKDGLTFALPPGAVPQLPSQRAKPGDVLTFYGVGFGPTTPDNPAGQIVQANNATRSTFQAFFAGVQAAVQYSGLASGYLGLYQFNVVVPNVAASDSVPLTFSLGGTSGTQTLIIPVQN